ncbi:hypothetical protein HWV62_45316 [Athelia sp. TMB]|nr:hypothetical protein HWV62_45316 [Athelia sp. TMB]
MYHAYGKLFKERVDPVVEKEWVESVKAKRVANGEKDAPIPSMVPIDFRNTVVKRLLSLESDEVKAEVEAWRIAELNGRCKQDKGGEDEDEELSIPERYHRAQQALSPTIQRLLENVWEQAGVMGLFMFVGPQPIRGGNLGVTTIVYGENYLGQDFTDVYTAEKWKENVEVPLLKFGATMFFNFLAAESVCRERALGGVNQMSNAVKSSNSRSPSLFPSNPSNTGPVAELEEPPHRDGAPEQSTEAQSDEDQHIGQQDDEYGGDDEYTGGNEEGGREDDDDDENLNSHAQQEAITSVPVVTEGRHEENFEPRQEPQEDDRPAEEEAGRRAIGGEITKPPAESAPPRPDDTWDTDLKISPEERAVLMAMSDTERSRLLCVRRRDLDLLSDGTIDHLPPIVEIPVPDTAKEKKKKGGRSKTKARSTSEPEDVHAQTRRTRASAARTVDDIAHAANDQTSLIPTLHAASASDTPALNTPSTHGFGNSAVAVAFAPELGAPPNPDTLPDWVEEVLPHLDRMGDKNSQWKNILSKWVELERVLGFPKGRGKMNVLSSINRPAELGIWINKGRPWNDLPRIYSGTAEDYSMSWWLWWRSLQPAWRRRTATLSLDLRGTGAYTWDETRKGSISGFFVVLVSLGIWLHGLRNDKGSKWWCGSAMNDVEWVLNQMLTSGSTSLLGKRTSNESDRPLPSKRQRNTKP